MIEQREYRVAHPFCRYIEGQIERERERKQRRMSIDKIIVLLIVARDGIFKNKKWIESRYIHIEP